MAFTGNEGGSISLDEARTMIKRYEDTIGPEESRSHFFGRRLIDEVLTLKDCVGLRIFHAENEEGKRELVIAGEDSRGKLMLPTEGMKPAAVGNPGGYPHVVDKSRLCPTACNEL